MLAGMLASSAKDGMLRAIFAISRNAVVAEAPKYSGNLNLATFFGIR
jgi:hypothetical protein